ncbi:MAG: futalosine hydrolase [Gaiellales bacterium]
MSDATLLVVVATDAEAPAVDRVEVLVSGIGKVAAADATAHRLASGPARAVISFGGAGAYPGSELTLGDVVIAAEVALLDEGLETGEQFVALDRPGLAVPGARWLPADRELARRLLETPARAPASWPRVERGRIGTVSVCAGTARLARERQATGALCEAMEGAAVAVVAARHGVPFAEVRGISNQCGPRDEARFDLDAAIRSAERVLGRLGRSDQGPGPYEARPQRVPG